jgi:UDP-glucose 4-epimerase
VITKHLGVTPELIFGTEDRGWVGDNPFIFLDTQRIQTLGWAPKLTIRQGLARTIDWLSQNRWVFERRV